MLKISAAESFLSLFTTRDRASAIIGDLVEQRRASLLNILGTGASLFLRSARAQPMRLSLAAGLGGILWLVAGSIADILIRLGFRSHHYGDIYGVISWSIAIPALVGYVIARFTKNQEITGCMGFVILLAFVALGEAATGGYACTAQFLRSMVGFDFGVPAVILLVSGALTRNRALRRHMTRNC